MKRKTFLVRADWGASLRCLPDNLFREVVLAMFAYNSEEEVPELSPLSKAVFESFRSFFDETNEKFDRICEQRKEASAKAVAARKARKASSTERLPNVTERSSNVTERLPSGNERLPNNNDRLSVDAFRCMSTYVPNVRNVRNVPNVPDCTYNNINNIYKKNKKKYGERVAMTEEEHVKLCETFGEQLVNEHIPMADDWLLSKGETRKDYAAFMRNWLKKAAAQNRQVVRRGQQAPISRLKSPDLEQSAKDLTARGIKFADFSTKTASISRPNGKDDQVIALDDKPPF